MCEILGVSRCNDYSAVRRTEHTEPDPQHDELIKWVQKIADASDFTYGVRRRRKYKVITNSDLYLITCYHAILMLKSQTRRMSLTLPTSGHKKAGCIWP